MSKDNMLKFQSVRVETFEILINQISNTMRKFQIWNKIIYLHGDNCSTNFGGDNRRVGRIIF